MKYNGIVLASTFMKLGVLIPTLMAIVVFGEIPTIMQIAGIGLAIIAIIIIHFDNDDAQDGTGTKANKKIWLLVLLMLGGLGDSMSNIFEKLGPDSGKDGFLLLTFFTAFVITVAIVVLGKKKLCTADILFGLLVGVPNYFSARFLLASLGSLDAVIVYPTFSVGTMVVVTVVGVIAFHEKISKQKGIALGLIAVAIALLNM
jgi:drug/metabolite transporter (DMT)-like permease